jgi:hypothetical protein
MRARLAGWVAWFGLAGCGSPAEWGRSTDGLFPHESGYPSHGTDWLTRGEAACGSCHTEGRAAPACADCHADYPHIAGWSHGEVGKDPAGGVAASCASCHEAEGTVAAERAACTACHASWPHPTGWETGGHHGTYAMQRGSAEAACGTCHGATLAGQGSTPSCVECHPTWPHPEGWGAADGHGAAWSTSHDCGGCHATTETDGALGRTAVGGGTSGVACARCHATFPHPADWARSHPSHAATLGEPTCLSCHAAGDGPTLATAACAPACHGGTP